MALPTTPAILSNVCVGPVGFAVVSGAFVCALAADIKKTILKMAIPNFLMCLLIIILPDASGLKAPNFGKIYEL